MNEVIAAPSQLLPALPSQTVVMSIQTGIRKYATFPPQVTYLLFLSVCGHVSEGWLIG